MDEIGTVTEVLPNGKVVVSVERTSACVGCGMQGLCFPDGRKTMDVRLTTGMTCEVGQKVRLRIDSSRFLKYSFIVYLIPILTLLVGAVLGSIVTGSDGGQLLVVAGSIVGLAAGLLLVKGYSSKLESSGERVVEILND
ncbi:MAG: SoxR reducing system RseC family protein [Acidobacteria bacterium]|nr:SoxR reducing system RseC family protein [Acidobacteriota bacterium]